MESRGYAANHTRQAEAERGQRAKVIAAEGEFRHPGWLAEGAQSRPLVTFAPADTGGGRGQEIPPSSRFPSIYWSRSSTPAVDCGRLSSQARRRAT